jgi:hypothetical protein
MRPQPRRSIRCILAAGISCLFLAASPRPAGAQAFTFGVRVDFQLGGLSASNGVAVGDVNGDGNLDLIAVRTHAKTVETLLGNGAGGFSSMSEAPIGLDSGSNGLVLGDVNGDGRLDLAVGNGNSSFASVLLGNGAGGFGVRSDYPCALNVRDVKLADMTGDGRLDLVAVSYTAAVVSIFPGNGAGGFGARQDIPLPGNPTLAAIGDLNGDGRLDLCILHTQSTHTVSVLLSDGAGGFLPRVDYPTVNDFGIAIGDVNRDGRLDVVTTDPIAMNLSVFPGSGTGALGAKTMYPTGGGMRQPAIADMNGDGRADIAGPCPNTNSFAVMLGDGTGAFDVPVMVGAASSMGVVLGVGDFNGDGRPDLAMTSGSIPSYASLVFNGTGAAFRARTDVAVGATPRGVAVGDVNGDGRSDLVSANAGANTVSVLLGTLAGGFGPKTDHAVGAVPTGVAIGDVGGDGRADLLVTNSQGATVSLLSGNGVGGFGARADFATGAGPVSVALADLNGDGRLDASVANNLANTVSVLLNNSAGGFGPMTNYATGANPAAVAVGDLNADGLSDLVVSNGSSNSASVLLGTGGGTFGAKVDFTTGTTPLGVALGDVSGDGKLDLVAANSQANTVSLLLGTGTGGFAGKVDYAVGAAPSAVAIGDVNGDGRPDLSVANSNAASVSLLIGNGVGGFHTAVNSPVASGPQSIAVGDLTGDGRLDVAVAASGAAAVSVLPGLVPTKTALTVSASPIVAGSPMTLNATVSVPAPGIGAPSDSVRFFDGNTLLGTSPVLGGTAGLSLFAPYRGDRAITAVYKGDGKLFGSISNVVTPRVVATAAAAITDITDVASDQGGQARLFFARSPYDYLGSGIAITGYQVYRRAIVAGALQGAEPVPADVQLAGWDYVLTVPATTDDIYQAVVSTLADSNATGIHRAVLFVRAATATPGVYYDSPADSGYTVDNLAPAAPAPLTAVYSGGATHLHWAPNAEHDLATYRVYRGASAGFVPGAGNLIATRPDTGYADAGPPGSFYKVSALDVNGNQSAFALVGPDATTDVAPDGTTAFALERVRPNPAIASRLVISFSLPTAAPARLEVFDVRGRRVAGQEVGGRGAGRQAVPLWSAQLTPGVYLVRLSQGASSMTQRMTVVD